jgi:cytochrome c biogenesis protein CcdA
VVAVVSESAAMIIFGVGCVIAAFLVTAVGDRAMPSPYTRWRPVTRAQRIVFLIVGILALALGIARW